MTTGDDSFEISIRCEAPATDGLPAVHVGRSVPVTVELVCPERFESRGVIVRLKYEVTGRGNPEKKVVVEETPIHGAWEAGERGRRSLALRVPDEGPISYAGRLMDIHWSVEVQVDVKWAKDPVASMPLRVLPREAR